MSSSINLPNPWTFDTNLGGSVDTSIAVTELPVIKSDSSFKGTVSMDTGIAITQLPEIRLAITELPQIDIQIGIRPMRMHFPTHMKYTLCAFGMEVLSFSTCGERMVVIEDYEPHARERCR